MKRLLPLLCLTLFLAACAAPGQPPAAPTPTGLPVDWAALGLSGRLVYIRFLPESSQLVALDLANGQRQTLFRGLEHSVLGAAAVSPDGEQIVLSYSPPPGPQESFVFPGLYLMPADGSRAPQALTPFPSPDDSYYNPAWSPDGQYVYATHYRRGTGPQNPNRYTVERIGLDGQMTPLLEDAVWPRVSPDGAQLAFLSFDLETYRNDLYLADIHGQDAVALLPENALPTVDAHLFTPDGTSILFSAANQSVAAQPTWLERLLGIQVASAHDVPSDWYRVSTRGGEPARLTQIHEAGLYGAFSPDGRYVAYISQSGIYLLDPGSGEIRQISDENVTGTVDWVAAR
jgi:Tol biopolymer transport system component